MANQYCQYFWATSVKTGVIFFSLQSKYTGKSNYDDRVYSVHQKRQPFYFLNNSVQN